jgi:DNA-binding MarR family transcriptional regulator
MTEPRTRRITRAWFRMAQAVERVYGDMDAVFRAHGTTAPQFDVLATLLRHGDSSQRELAERLLVSKGNVSYVLARMETRGLVVREADPQDPRANRLRVTAKGRALYDRIMPDHDAVLARHFAGLDADGLDALARLVPSRLPE